MGPSTRLRRPAIARRAAALLLAACGAGCSIRASTERWQVLAQHAPDQRVALADVVARLRPIELPVPGRIEVRVTDAEPIVTVDGATSYGRLLRLPPALRGSVEIVVESWCDCPPTAVLWGALELPVFVPRLTLLDARGQPLDTIDGEARRQETWWRNMPIIGTWRVELAEPGPAYLLVTSARDGPSHLGEAGMSSLIASPDGRLRVTSRVARQAR